MVATSEGAADRTRRERGTALRRIGAVLRFARTLARSLAAAWDKDATERAAALTYYAVLALFPALLMTISLLGLAGGYSQSSLSTGITTLLPNESRAVGQLQVGWKAAHSLAAFRGEVQLVNEHIPQSPEIVALAQEYREEMRRKLRRRADGRGETP